MKLKVLAPAAAFLIVACSDPTGSTVATLEAPSSLTIANGTQGTVPLTARDASGNTVSLTGVTWTSSHTSIVRVNAAGVVTSQGLGTTTVTARIGQATAQIVVRVVPATVTACETNTATLCAPWTFSNGQYTAIWSQGSQAVIRVERFDTDSVRFVREDPAGTSAGMVAVYRGIPSPSGVTNGLVTWTPPNHYSFNGRWSANW